MHSEPRILVAGLGNIFLGDDAFGAEVVQRLSAMSLPETVRLVDIGTRSVHLAYDLLDRGYDASILIDVVRKGGAPGCVYLLEAEDEDDSVLGCSPDGHSMVPHRALAFARRFGARPGRVLIVGCEPEHFDTEKGISPAVRAAVDEAARMVLDLISSVTPPRRAAAEV
jgi:hydrogenase maturation protease